MPGNRSVSGYSLLARQEVVTAAPSDVRVSSPTKAQSNLISSWRNLDVSYLIITIDVIFFMHRLLDKIPCVVQRICIQAVLFGLFLMRFQVLCGDVWCFFLRCSLFIEELT